MNVTSNEMFNYKRYNYLKNGRTGKYHNPYSRGIFYNLAEFFLCVEPLEGEPIPDNSEAADDNELIWNTPNANPELWNCETRLEG